MPKQTFLLIVLALALGGCALQAGISSGTPTPFIITATLPATAIPTATLTPIPPTPSPTTVPIDGMTTTQVNVRDRPSTAGTQLTILPPFSKVQIVGQDADSNWYMILYPDGANGTGWVTAQYVNVTQGKDRIPVIGGSPSHGATPGQTQAGSSSTGVVVQQVNVRNGPGTEADPLGMLNPKDVVVLIGRDPSGSWFQIQYPGAPDGVGWVAGAYIDASGVENVPIIGSSGAVIGTGTPSATPVVLTPTPGAALEDNDSAQAPAVRALFSPGGSRTLIYTSDLSSPGGDAQDWVEFTPFGPDVLFVLNCTGNAGLVLQLLLDDSAVAGWNGPGCGDSQMAQLVPGKAYMLHITLDQGNGSRSYVLYSLRVENMG